MLRDAVAIAQRYKSHHTEVLLLIDLSRLLKATNRLKEAEKHLRGAAALCEKQDLFGPWGAWFTPSINEEMADLLIKTGRPAEALGFWEGALKWWDGAAVGGSRVTNIASRTADALDALGRADEAKALRERYGLGGPEGP